jgi:hypothetical protein
MKNEKIRLGTQIASLEYEGVELSDWPYHFYAPFRTQKPATMKLKFKKESRFPELLKSSKLLFDGSNHWKLYSENGHLRLDLFDTGTHEKNRAVVLNHDFSEATIYVEREKWMTQLMLRPLLEIMSLNVMASQGGLLLHGAAVRDHDRAYLFIGPSGAGKTTISQFWAKKEGDYSVLGDERTIVQKEKEGWFVYGTPWPGMGFTVSGERVPLSHIFFIRHGDQNKIEPASKSVLFQELFTQVFSSFWNAETLHQITETCERLITEVPSYLLPFEKSPDITDVISDFCQKNG